MNKIPLSSIKKRVQLRSASLAVPEFWKLLGINKNFSSDEVFEEILRDSLATFERYEPEIRFIQTYVTPDSDGWYEFTENYVAVDEGTVEFKFLELIPNAVVGTTINSMVPSPILNRLHVYRKPRIKLHSTSSRLLSIKGVFNRPLRVEYNQDKTFNEVSCLYLLSDDRSNLTNMFINQVTKDVLFYINSQKNNFSLPNLPVDVFGSLTEQISKLERVLEEWYTQSTTRGRIIP